MFKPFLFHQIINENHLLFQVSNIQIGFDKTLVRGYIREASERVEITEARVSRRWTGGDDPSQEVARRRLDRRRKRQSSAAVALAEGCA